MGLIIQMQRRAIERLRDNAPSPLSDMEAKILTLADGTRIYPWGTSTGEGSCSDIKGMNVLVVGSSPFGSDVWLRGPLQKHAYVVLSREVTDAEREEYYRRNPWKPGLGCVELLRHVRTDEQSVIFERTGRVEIYIVLA